MITFVQVGDDWEAVYKDNALVLEGHSTNPRDLLDILGIAYQSKEMNDNQAYELNSGAKTLSEVKFK